MRLQDTEFERKAERGWGTDAESNKGGARCQLKVVNLRSANADQDQSTFFVADGAYIPGTSERHFHEPDVVPEPYGRRGELRMDGRLGLNQVQGSV